MPMHGSPETALATRTQLLREARACRLRSMDRAWRLTAALRIKREILQYERFHG